MSKGRKRTEAWLMALMMILTLLVGCSEHKQESAPPETGRQESREEGLTMERVRAGAVITPGKREETVTVSADASGKPKRITSEIRLSDIDAGAATGSLFVQDVSDLTDIKNKEGDEDWVREGRDLFWEYKGEVIRYQGTATGDSPFGLEVTYYLNGVLTPPEQLAGASGDLRIRFDYTNDTEESGDYVPAAAMTVVILPEKTFADVEVENGTVLDLAGQRAVMGLAFPGLREHLTLETYEPTKDTEIPDHVEIRCRVTDFKLSFTATVFSTGFFAELEEEDLEDLRKIPDKMDDLADASRELVEGTGELYDGVEELVTHAKDYFDGVHSLKKGAKKLKEGFAELEGNTDTLEEGAAALEKGLKKLKQGLAKIDVSGLSELSKLDLSQMTKGLSKVDLTALADQLEPMIGKDQADQLRGLQASLTQLTKAAGQLQELTKAAGKLSKSLTSLKKGVTELYKGSSQLTKGIRTYGEGVSALTEGMGSLYDGAAELDKAGTKLQEALEELLDGVGELKDGFAEFDEEGIRELKKYAGEELRTILVNITELKDTDAAFRAFSAKELPDGTEGSLRFIIETEEIK